MSIFRVLVPVALALATWLHSGDVRADSAANEAAAAKKLVERAGKVAKAVARHRGLKITKRINRVVMDKSQIRARLVKILEQRYTPEQLATESLALKRLGLIPAKINYKKVLGDLLQEQAASFYDQDEKKLLIAGWVQSGADMLMAHEIAHALQDQHFDLVKFMADDRKNRDSMAARHALVEGDGMATMLEFQMAGGKQAPPWGSPVIMRLLREGMDREAESMKHIPLALREALMFPYVGGVEFVGHFRKHHKWSVIDEMYKKPPLSTEHILHPEKYESYEKPIVVTIHQPPGLVGYNEKVSNVIGEKGIEIFLRSHGVSRARAVAAGAGWGGDRLAVYAREGHQGSGLDGTVGVWLTSWDEELDAREFTQALEHALPNLAAGAKGVGKGGVMTFASNGQNLVAERKGSRVLLLLGAPKKKVDALRADVWKTLGAT